VTGDLSAPPSSGSKHNVQAESDHTQQMGRIARSGSLNLVGAAAGGAFTVVLTSLVANQASPSVAGSFFAVTSVFLILSAVAELGSEVSLARFLPRFVALARRSEMLLCIRMALVASLVAGVVIAIAVIGFGAQLADLLASSADQAATRDALVLLAVAIPATALMNTALSATRGLSTVKPSVLVDKLGRGGLQIALVMMVLAAGGGIAAITTAWVVPNVLAAAAALLWLLLIVRRGRVTADAADQPRTRAEVTAEYVSFTWPRALARLCQMALQRADIVAVAALRSPAEAAVYTLATRFLVVGQIGTLAIQQVLAPHSSRLLAQGDETAARKVYQTTTAWTMALCWPLYLATLSCAPVLLTLIGGSAYRSGEAVVVVLSCAALAAVAFGPVDTILLMSGSSGRSLVNSVVSLTVDLAVLFTFVPRFGIVAAAAGWAAAIAVRNILGLVMVRHAHGWVPFDRAAALVAAISVSAFGVLPTAARLSGHSSTGLLLALLGVGVPLYVMLLLRFRRALSLHAFITLLPGRTTHPVASS
jgi:O-antigen/teichoic acid export membrane protein